jgi:prevent-host-death family protein
MDTYVNATEARQRFLQLLDAVQEGDQVIVTRYGAPTAVLIDFERLETLKSLARLWQDPEALRGMKEASEQIKAGRTLRMKG